MKERALIIGFPGAVASQVARMLSCSGMPTTMLVSSGDMRVARVFRKTVGEHLTLLCGSPHQIDFGLSGEHYMELVGTTRVVLSLLPQVMDRSDTPSGTLTRIGREIIEFALTAGPQTRVLHLSSVDVRGNATGLFAEADVDIGQKPPMGITQERLRNERILSRFRSRFAVTVVRSGIVVGTGAGLYPLIPLILAEPTFFSRYDESGLSLTPLTGLVAFILQLIQSPEDIAGRTFHFFADSDKSPRHLSAYLTALARETFGAEADPTAVARRFCESTGFTARTFWQHNAIMSGVSNGWTKAFFAARGFCLDDHLEIDWDRLMSDTVNDLLARENRKEDES